VLTEYHRGEKMTATKRKLGNALKFGQSGEVHSKEGCAKAEWLEHAPPNCSEAGASQVKLNGAVGEALIQQPPLQCPRTKLIIDVRIDDSFLD